MIVFQILSALFCLFALTRVIIKHRAHEIKTIEMIMWVLFWLGAIVVFLVPDSTAKLARLFGIGRGVDLVVYISLTVLFYIVFRLIARLDKVESNLTKITRNIALEKKSTDKKD